MASSMFSRLINLSVEYNPDGCWAISSPDLPGLVLAGKDIAALLDDVPNAIRLLFKLNYQMDVQVARAEEDGPQKPKKAKQAGFIPLPHTFVALHAA